MASANVGRAVPEKSADFWGALQMLFTLSLYKIYSVCLLTLSSIAENKMAKIEPMDLVKSLSGKLCGHSDISFAKKGDTQYTMKRCNKRSSEPTEAELAQRAKFAAVSAAVNARLKANDPADLAAFKAQKKYKTLRKYLWQLETEKYELENA